MKKVDNKYDDLSNEFIERLSKLLTSTDLDSNVKEGRINLSYKESDEQISIGNLEELSDVKNYYIARSRDVKISKLLKPKKLTFLEKIINLLKIKKNV